MSENIQELLDAVDIEEYLDDQGIDYRIVSGSSGRQANLKTCPVCGASKWKVYIGLDSGFGNCFSGSCGARWNKWSFIKAHLGVEKAGDVVRHLKEVAKGLGWRPRKMITVAVDHGEVKLPLSYPLPIDGQNLMYLEERGITAEYAAYFHLRYCEYGTWDYKKADGSPGVQNFANRVIIPVYDLDGRLVTFQGRDLTGTSDRKYLFPSSLPGTGRFLLNGQNAAKAKRVVMGEGAFDVMAIKIAVDGEIALRDIVPVGSFGKHLSHGDANCNDQVHRFIQLKGWGLEEITVMWDGEPAALTAAVEAGMILRQVGLRVKIALLPKDKDPNEVPADVVRQTIWEAKLLTPALAVQWRLRNPYA
jgi:DNA primase